MRDWRAASTMNALFRTSQTRPEPPAAPSPVNSRGDAAPSCSNFPWFHVTATAGPVKPARGRIATFRQVCAEQARGSDRRAPGNARGTPDNTRRSARPRAVDGPAGARRLHRRQRWRTPTAQDLADAAPEQDAVRCPFGGRLGGVSDGALGREAVEVPAEGKRPWRASGSGSRVIAVAFYRREPGRAAQRGDWKPARPPASAGRVRYPTTTNCGLVRQFPRNGRKAPTPSAAQPCSLRNRYGFSVRHPRIELSVPKRLSRQPFDSHFGPSLARTISCYIT